MHKKILLLCFGLLTSLLSAQQTMNFNTKSYPATPSWQFLNESYALSGSAQIQIAKTEKGGLLQLSVEATDPAFQIAGTIFLDLIDMTIIVCTDKNFHKTEGNQIISYYVLSPIEMTRLQKTDIQSVRFSIKGKQTKFSSQTGHFTAVNKKAYFATAYDRTKKSYDTAFDIHALYNNGK